MSRRTLPNISRNPARNRRSFVPDQVVRCALETRQLLSTATLSSAGVLTVTGTSGPDTITVLQSGASVNAAGSTFATSSVRSIVVNALDGNDTISIASSIPATLNCGAGTNTYPSVPANDTVIDPFLTAGVAMSKAVMDEYQSLGGWKDLVVGNPTGNEVAAFGGRVVHFQYGEIDYSAATGAHQVDGQINSELVATASMTDAYGNSVRNILGLATSDESVGFGGRLDHFQGGDIDWSAATGAHAVYGTIWIEMNATAGETDANGSSVRGILGLPTADETSVSGGRVSHFQGGDIDWSAATGAHVVYGAILAEYNATAGEVDAFGHPVKGILGLPTSDESSYATTGRVSHFQGGDIVSSAATGAHVLYGWIGQTYWADGLETEHLLGFPTTDEAPGPNGSRVVAFQGGSLYTSSPQIVIGANHSQAISALKASQTEGLLDATEIAFFRGIASPSNVFTDPATANLMSQLINGDPANATYQGIAVGNLGVGSPAWKVNDLMQKWFLGLDHPTDAWQRTNSDGSKTSFNGGFYEQTIGPLFGNAGPSYADIKQGQDGDCFLLASLAETAARSPGTIRDMFTDNGDGTYSVRFFENGVKEYVTVDGTLPDRGEYYNINNPGQPIWASLAEKAYAQVNESGWLKSTIVGLNSYAALDTGFDQVALNAINGQVATGGSSDVGAAWAAGKEIVVFTTGEAYSTTVVSNHIYAVIGYNSTSQLFTLFNPWGVDGGYETNPITKNEDFKAGLLYLNKASMSTLFKGSDSTTSTGSSSPDLTTAGTPTGSTTARPGSPTSATASHSSPVIVPLVLGDPATTPADGTDEAVATVKVGSAHPRHAGAAWTVRH